MSLVSVPLPLYIYRHLSSSFVCLSFPEFLKKLPFNMLEEAHKGKSIFFLQFLTQEYLILVVK